MKSKFLMFIIMIVLLLSSCSIIESISGETATPYATSTPAVSNSPFNTMGITPNVTEFIATPSPSAANTNETTASATATHTPTAEPMFDSQLKLLMNSYLPPLDTTLRYFGIAETGHYGSLSLEYDDGSEAMYEFDGTYDDGMGVPDKFAVRYYFNYSKGTITEKAEYNERLQKNEFHSKLHNIVVLKFPLSLGAVWNHETTIDGLKYWVNAKITELTSNKVSVLYTVSDVPGYYNNTYFEMRTYEKGYGMTSFSNIMPGEIDMTGVDTTDADAVEEYILNMWMFGYSLNK